MGKKNLDNSILEDRLLERERERYEERENLNHQYDSEKNQDDQFERIAAKARISGYNRHGSPNDTSIANIKAEVENRPTEKAFQKARKRAGQYIKYSSEK